MWPTFINSFLLDKVSSVLSIFVLFFCFFFVCPIKNYRLFETELKVFLVLKTFIHYILRWLLKLSPSYIFQVTRNFDITHAVNVRRKLWRHETSSCGGVLRDTVRDLIDGQESRNFTRITLPVIEVDDAFSVNICCVAHVLPQFTSLLPDHDEAALQ